MKGAVRTKIKGLISFRLGVASFRKGKEIIPKLRPLAMLKVKGVATRVRKAGKAKVRRYYLNFALAFSLPYRFRVVYFRRFAVARFAWRSRRPATPKRRRKCLSL